MQQFFSKILKRKKTLFVFLFLAIIAITVPQIASASFWDWANPISNILTSLFFALLTFSLSLPILFAMVFATISKTILNLAILYSNSQSYTHSSAVNTGWPIVRDLANMMIVLGFIIIGISTALRIKEYEAKQLLPKLIIVAILVNFSLLLCGVFIDGSNIVMTFFFGKSGDISTWIPTIPSFSGLFDNISMANIADIAPKFLGMAFFNFIGGFVYLLYGGLILFRIIALWMLVILSPLAFVCYVFPATKKIWDVWWNNFFQWCIIVMPAGLFYYIGSQMISKPLMAPIDSNNFMTVNFATYLSNSFSTILVPGLFLIVGFLFALQSSAMGASAMLSLVKKNAGKIAMGGLGVLSKSSGTLGKASAWAGNKLGGNNNVIGKTFNAAATGLNKYQGMQSKTMERIQKTRSDFGRGLETIGGQKVGTQAGVDQARIEATAKLSTAALNSKNQGDIDRIVKSAITGAGIEQAGSLKALAGQNKLGLLPTAQKQEAISRGLKNGLNFGDVANGMESNELADIINNSSHPLHNDRAVAEGFKTLTKRGHLDLINDNPAIRQNAVEQAMKNGMRIEDAEKADYHYAAQNPARKQRIKTDNPAFTDAQVNGAAINQALDENIVSMSHAQLRNVDSAHLTAKRIDKLTPDKINAFQYAPQASRDIIRSHFGAGGELYNDYKDANKEYKDALKKGDTARATNRFTEFRRLHSMTKAAGNLP